MPSSTTLVDPALIDIHDGDDENEENEDVEYLTPPPKLENQQGNFNSVYN